MARSRIRSLVVGVVGLLLLLTSAGVPGSATGAERPDCGMAFVTPQPSTEPPLSLPPTTPVTPASELPPDPPTGAAWPLVLSASAFVAGFSRCSLDDVVAWDGGYVASAHRRSGRERRRELLAWWTSPDGVTWQPHSPPDKRTARAQGGPMIAYAGGLLLFGFRHGALMVWRSEDGQTWQQQPPRPGFVSDVAPLELDAVSSGRRILVRGTEQVGCEAGRCPGDVVLWTSEDGQAWTRTEPSRNARRRLYAIDPGGIVADTDGGFVARGQGRSLIGSGDGITWSRVGSLPDGYEVSEEIGSIPGRGTTYLLTRMSDDAYPPRAVVLASDDLRTWAVVYRSSYPEWSALRLTTGIAGLVLTGFDEGDFLWVVSSADGAMWEESVGWPGMEHGDPTSAAVGPAGAVIVAFGQNEDGNLIWSRGNLET